MAYVRIRPRRSTSEEWEFNNPILALKNNNIYEKIYLVTDNNVTDYYVVNNPTYTPIDKFYNNKEEEA